MYKKIVIFALIKKLLSFYKYIQRAHEFQRYDNLHCISISDEINLNNSLYVTQKLKTFVIIFDKLVRKYILNKLMKKHSQVL